MATKDAIRYNYIFTDTICSTFEGNSIIIGITNNIGNNNVLATINIHQVIIFIGMIEYSDSINPEFFASYIRL